mmetsp:Transcript_1289/g.3234  ORF Transcript_1289/g.3234 Transcript_1289/m.3234 type:complete len:265 (+) Transcript_1289:100-894(+)
MRPAGRSLARCDMHKHDPMPAVLSKSKPGSLGASHFVKRSHRGANGHSHKPPFRDETLQEAENLPYALPNYYTKLGQPQGEAIRAHTERTLRPPPRADLDFSHHRLLASHRFLLWRGLAPRLPCLLLLHRLVVIIGVVGVWLVVTVEVDLLDDPIGNAGGGQPSFDAVLDHVDEIVHHLRHPFREFRRETHTRQAGSLATIGDDLLQQIHGKLNSLLASPEYPADDLVETIHNSVDPVREEFNDVLAEIVNLLTETQDRVRATF